MTILLQGAGIQAVVSTPPDPQFDSSEIGAVNASTLVVTFDRDMNASDYSTGVTIKVNGTATSITSATRQSNHAIVRYVIPVLWHGSGDAVAWEYDSTVGNIVSESDSTPLGDVTAQSVTNNCEYTALLDLQADMLVLNDGDPVSTWADQSGNGRDFTQADVERPSRQTQNSYPSVLFDTINKWMLGGDFADNLQQFVIMTIQEYIGESGNAGPVIAKLDNWVDGDGWLCEADNIQTQGQGGTIWAIFNPTIPTPVGFHLTTRNVISLSSDNVELYKDGIDQGFNMDGTGGVADYPSNRPVILARTYSGDSHWLGYLYSVVIFSPAPNATNRAALETRLGARYGLTVP